MIDLIALSAAKKHADLLAMGLTSVSVNNTNKSITFTLAADGSQHTIYFDQPSDGVSIIGVEIKNDHLVCLMSDGSEIDAGVLPSGSGGGSVPKPLTYDYMPEGYPSKSIQDVTLLENQEITFETEPEGHGYQGMIEVPFKLVDGKTYVVTWDGYEYECLARITNGLVIIGNTALEGIGDDTGEPFLVGVLDGRMMCLTHETNRVHIITIKTETEAITPIAYDYMPEGYPSKKSGWSIEWDGNTEGLVVVDEIYFKVSNSVLTDDEFIGSTAETSNGFTVEITSDNTISSENIITTDFVIVVKKDNVTVDGFTFPQKGIYFVNENGEFYITKLSKQTITPMADEFMPDDHINGLIDAKLGVIENGSY